MQGFRGSYLPAWHIWHVAQTEGANVARCIKYAKQHKQTASSYQFVK